MIHYYINPKTLSLIMYDTEGRELFVTERIEKVRVMIGGEVRIGEFDGPNPNDLPDKFDDHPQDYRDYIGRNKRTAEQIGRSKTRRVSASKVRHCGNCGEAGHQARTCPKAKEPAAAE